MHWNGWAAAHIADYGVPGFPNFGKVLVANHGLPEADRNSGEKITVEISIGVIPEASCDGRIQPLLYAVDVFVPVLNLRQQTASSISTDHAGWRHAQALYALLGWFLTPLALLTVSGILKRHAEK